MKKLLPIVLAAALLIVACKKNERAPEGPTDVRIKNVSTFTLHDLTVDIDTVVNYGVINAQATSNYIRFPKAYPKVKITAKVNIDGSLVTFASRAVDYTYMQYMGRMRITYVISIPSVPDKLIEMEVIPEEGLFLNADIEQPLY